MKRFFVLLIITSIFTSCKKENMCDCFKRTGSIVIKERELSGFDRLFVEDNIDVYLTQAPSYSVKVEAGKNIEPLIKTEVINGALVIRNDNKCNWARSYKKPLNVYVALPTIYGITSDGTGNIKGESIIVMDSIDIRVENVGDVELTLNTNKLITRSNGAGDIILRGNTNEHASSIGGTGFLKCSDLYTSFSYLHSYTLGECYVNCSNNFVCKIDNKGDVYCYGNPSSVDKTTTSTGNLYLR